MHPHSEGIPPFCIIRSVKMYIFYRFIDIYRFSTSSPAQWGGSFYILTNTLTISELSLCSQERLFGARTQLGVTPSPSKPLPMGREGAGQGSMAEGPSSGTALPLPGSTWGQVQAGTTSPASSASAPANRAASLGRAAAAEGAISRKKPTTTTLKHLLQAQLPRPAQEASVQAGAAGAPRWFPPGSK